MRGIGLFLHQGQQGPFQLMGGAILLRQCVLQFLDGLTLRAVTTLNKVVRAAVQQEEHVYTVDNPRFIHGSGMKTLST